MTSQKKNKTRENHVSSGHFRSGPVTSGRTTSHHLLKCDFVSTHIQLALFNQIAEIFTETKTDIEMKKNTKAHTRYYHYYLS